MRKLLFFTAVLVAANSFSAINITGGNSGEVIGVSSSSPFAQSVSGTITFTQINAAIELHDGSDELLAGTKIILPPNGVLEIKNLVGATLVKIVGDPVYQSEYTTTTAHSGGDQLLGPTLIINATPLIPPAQAPAPAPVPAPAPKEEIPRSRVNLDLIRNTKSTVRRNMENYKENGFDFNIEYTGGLGGVYKDKGDIIKYDAVSNGIILTGTKNFGSVTLGTTFGYHDSKVKYKEYFQGFEEKIGSYQLGLSARYNLTDKTDMTAIFTYGEGKHKFKAPNVLSKAHDMEYKSKIYDFDWRMGTKYAFENGYIKPYLGFGVTLVDEKEIEKIGAGNATDYFEYTIVGAYGELNFGKIDLFGNFEYTQRLSKDSYHVKRSYGSYGIDPLKYSRAEYNLGLGAKYRVNDMFNVSANYELDNFKNNIFRVGFGMEF